MRTQSAIHIVRDIIAYYMNKPSILSFSPLRSTAAAAALILLTASGATATPVLEPATQKFIDGLAGSTPIYKLTPEAVR
jgi:hypothetical protein